MKVDKVIFSSDDSHYLDFWKINSEITYKKLGIKPVLFHITDEDSDFYEDEFGIIKKVKKLEKFSTSNQAQVFRMYGTKYFMNEVCLISDIDMFFFNKEYLLNKIENIDNDDMVILNSDAYDESRPECVYPFCGPDRYAICYVISKGKNFDKILNTKISFDEYMSQVELVGAGYNNDEIFFGKKVNNQRDVNVHKIKRGYSSNFYAPGRIEKYMFEDSDKSVFKLDINGYLDINQFIDCHCKSPYLEYKHLIDKIKNKILND